MSHNTSVAIDPQGAAHITYFDQKSESLALASRDGSGWNFSTVDDDGDTGLFSSLVIDRDDRFHISYLKRTSNSPGVVKYATRASGDAVWEIRSVDTVTKLTFGFIGARNITDVASWPYIWK